MKHKLVLLFSCAVLSIAAPITVGNPSFEIAIMPQNAGNGPFSQVIVGGPAQGGTLDAWTASSTTTNAQAGAFSPNMGGNNWTAKWWGGNNIGYLIAFQTGTLSLSQTLSTVLDSNADYTLTVDVGRRQFTPIFDYKIQLFAGTTLLASASNLALAKNSSGADSATYSSPMGNPLAGQALKIVLTTTSTSAFTEAFFDNVRLDAVKITNPVPEPAGMTMLATGAAFILVRRKRR